jgi:Fe-S-cluster containining protein
MSDYLKTPDGDEHPVGDKRTPIECFRCGVCCIRYQPQLAPDEVETIARGLGLSKADFLARYAQFTNVGYLIRRSEEGCVFLTWEEDGVKSTCTIHPFRPKSCRSWAASLSRVECREGLASLKAGD